MSTVRVLDLLEPTDNTYGHLREKLPALGVRLDALDEAAGRPRAADSDQLARSPVLATRQRAQDIAEKLPSLEAVVLDFDGIDVASAPFLDELAKLRPIVGVINANEDIAESWALVMERRR